MRYVTRRYLERHFGLPDDAARDIIQRRTLHAILLSWGPWLWLAVSVAGIVVAYADHIQGSVVLVLVVLALLGWGTVARVMAGNAIIDTARRLAARLADSARGEHGGH